MKRGWKIGLLVGAAALAAGVLYDGTRLMAPRPAANIVARDLQGKEWSLATRLGQRPLVVSFFATWCSPCAMELPHLLELREKHPDLEVVLLTEEDRPTVQGAPRFATAPVTILTDASPAFQAYEVSGLPRTLLFNRQGELAVDLSGFSEESIHRLEEQLQ